MLVHAPSLRCHRQQARLPDRRPDWPSSEVSSQLVWLLFQLHNPTSPVKAERWHQTRSPTHMRWTRTRSRTQPSSRACTRPVTSTASTPTRSRATRPPRSRRRLGHGQTRWPRGAFACAGRPLPEGLTRLPPRPLPAQIRRPCTAGTGTSGEGSCAGRKAGAHPQGAWQGFSQPSGGGWRRIEDALSPHRSARQRG